MSGHHYDAAQSTAAARPRKLDHAIYSFPSVHFDGTGQSLNLPDFLSTATAGEMIVVLRATSATPRATVDSRTSAALPMGVIATIRLPAERFGKASAVPRHISSGNPSINLWISP